MQKEWLKTLKAEYPKRGGAQGWKKVERMVIKRISEGYTFEEMLSGTRVYKKWCDFTGKTGSELVKMAATFYGPDLWFAEDYPIPFDLADLTGDAKREYNLDKKAVSVGVAQRLDGETLDEYHGRIAKEWRRQNMKIVK